MLTDLSKPSGVNAPSTEDAASDHSRRTNQGLYTINDLSRECGVTLRALRFYESKSLLNPQRIGSSRLYNEEDRRRLKLILKGKQLGFTLREIVDLVAAGSEVEAPNTLRLTREQCIEQLKLLERQKREIEYAINELRRTYSGLYEQGLCDSLNQWR